jgi:Lrp/AsnC family transcriptional regulator, leucine-responsive regulatory protein
MCVRHIFPALELAALDDRDRQILTVLAENAWVTYADLGVRIHLSASAAQRRVERLIADGIITGARACISPAALGRPIRIYVLVQLADESKLELNAFSRNLIGLPELVEAHYVAGVADILLVLQTADMEQYSQFADKHLNGNPNVRRYDTLTSLRSLPTA